MEKLAIESAPHMDSLWIKYQLGRRGYTLTGLGQEHGVSRHAVSLALRKPYPRMEAVIAAAVGMHPAELWPDRYDEHGNPNRAMGRPKKSIASSIENHKKRTPRNGKNIGRQ